ncbi:Fcf1-domain-containing protein, partial [Favolaschia claudopus]
KAKKTRKFAAVKRMLNPNDIRLKENQLKQKMKEEKEKEKSVRRVTQVASSMFLAHNTALVPPYRVLVDTNFINFSLQNKLELVSGMMDCLYAKCIPCITDCVMAELEKLGHRYRVALRIARDPRFERLKCSHSGTYADDCLVQRVTSHKCYIVATCDRDLRRRIRQIPGIPLMYPLVSHVLEAISRKGGPRPLFVALQGPQGSGKSYLSALLVAELRTRSLNTALLSLDDIYLPHAELVTLAELHPDNPLWRGRGQPGTHDVPLGLHVLSQLEEGKPVEIPRFDKSLYNGEGDRLPAGFAGGVVVDPPVDVVIFEGWCVGFYPVSIEKLDALWNGAWVDQSQQLGLGDSVQKQNVSDVNDTLKDYIPLWNFFDTFVQLQPTPSAEESPLSVVYLWRLEQEHNMKARNGGKGMSDESVKAFVDRYIPGYVFFGGGPAVGFGSEAPRWLGNSLRVHIDDKRMVVATETF